MCSHLVQKRCSISQKHTAGPSKRLPQSILYRVNLFCCCLFVSRGRNNFDVMPEVSNMQLCILKEFKCTLYPSKDIL